MATGKFRLFYKDGNVDHACAGVHYQVLSPGGAIAGSGKTDAHGETVEFNSASGPGTYELQVREGPSGGWSEPDVHDGPENKPEIRLAALSERGATTRSIRVKPYLRVRFHTHPDRKPIPGAKFTARTLDANGKRVIARELEKSKPVDGTTDAKGETGVIWCASSSAFSFVLPNTGGAVSVHTKALAPLVKGQDFQLYEFPFKTAIATTGPDPAKQADMAGKKSLPVLISPADQELIMVPQSDFDEFEEMSGRLDKIMGAAHLAKLDLSRALESQTPSEIAAAEKALGLAEDKVKSELNKNFSKLADLKEVVTLESFNKSGVKGESQMGLRRRYLKSDKYLQLKAKRINKSEYKLNLKFGSVADTKGGASVSPKSLDVAALKKSFEKISVSLKTSKEWKSDPKVVSLLDVAGNEFADTLLKSDTYEVDAQAQWLRFVGAAGANAEVDWKKKKALIQGNLQAKLILCEGKTTGRWAVPSLKGWMMSFGGEDLGALRFVLECELYGFAGAKLMASGAVGIALKDGKQVAIPVKKDDSQSLAKSIDPKTKLPRFQPDSPYAKMPENLNGVQAEVNAFAGVEAGVTPGGKIQWLPPRQKEFVSFAEVSGTLAGNAGIGAAAQLYIYMAEGKFRVRVAAQLCFGLGGKGSVDFTVNADKIGEFVEWIAYQLLHAGFRKLVYFAEAAFGVLSRLLLLCVAHGSPEAKAIEAWAANIDVAFRAYITSLELAKTRREMVDNINRVPPWLVHATPETRGMLLYQITRHGTPSHARDLPSSKASTFLDLQIHYLSSHKEAVCKILEGVQTAREWANVMEHMSVRGSKVADPGKKEGDVVRFLNNGVSLADLPPVMSRMNQATTTAPAKESPTTGNAFLDRYLKKRDALIDRFPKGYQVAQLTPYGGNGMHRSGQPSADFAQIATRGIGEAMPGDPGSHTG
ncbi:MAG: hypothetical protein Tsb007_31320 [Rhizobacter sp.]